MKKFILIILYTCFFSILSYGGYVKDMSYKLIQPDGDTIECYISGDEFYRRYYDRHGYTITKHPVNGYYVYANIVNDEIIATNYIVGKANPQDFGIIPNQDISTEKKIAIRKNRLDFYPAEATNIAKSTSLRSGTLNNITIYIKFTDGNFSHSKTAVEAFYNDTTRGASLFSYYRDISNGQFSMPSTFYPKTTDAEVLAYEDINPRGYYQPYNESTNTNGYIDDNEGFDRLHALLRNAINYLAPQIEEDFTAAELDNSTVGTNGLVDNISFIIQGVAGDWGSVLWPHRWSISGTPTYLNGKECSPYFLVMENHLFNVSNGKQSVLVHEMYHVLDAPDLYSYINSSLHLVLHWDIMAYNAVPPQHSTSYIAQRYGRFIPEIPEINSCGEFTVYSLWDRTPGHNTAYKIHSLDSPDDWYYIEYRKRTNEVYESCPSFSGEGIIIYRVNTSTDGNYDYESDSDNAEVYVFRPNGTPTNEVDGEILNAYFSSQSGRTSFNDNSNPPCFNSLGITENIEIFDISASGGDSMTFKVRMPFAPIADFDLDSTPIIYVGDSIHFINNSSCATNILWDFGDGATSTEENPTHQYNETGSFTVTLSISNDYGNDSITLTIIVVPENSLPLVDFSYDTTNACSGYISFTNLSLLYTSLEWDFGDGNTSNDPNPIHQYLNSGNYFVSLSATNQYGTEVYSPSIPINITRPETPTVTNAFSCDEGLITLFANASDSINWYQSEEDNTFFHTGNSYSDNFTETATFYVENDKIIIDTINNIAGENDKNFGTNAAISQNGTSGLKFDVYQNIILKSVTVYNSFETNKTINLADSLGNIIYTTAITIPSDITNGTTIPLNWTIPQGNGYRLLATSGKYLYRTTSNVNYPYIVPDIISITNGISFSDTTNIHYNIFYNLEIISFETSHCVSSKAEITANILESGPILASNDTAICSGDSVTISAVCSPDWDLYFQGNTENGNDLSILSNSETISQAGSYYFRAYSPEGNCWGEEAEINLIVNPVPENAQLENTSIESCEGNIVDFEEIENAHWFYLGNEVSFADSDGIYTVICIDPTSGCRSEESDSVEFVFHQLPDITCPNNIEIIQDTIITLTENVQNAYFSGEGINGNTFSSIGLESGDYLISYHYTDTITNCENSCIFTITVVNDSTNNFNEENYNKNISIFPNPNKGTFTIKINNFEKADYYQIIDSQGKIVAENIIDGTEILISKKLMSGHYIVSIFGDGKIYKKQIIVNN